MSTRFMLNMALLDEEMAYAEHDKAIPDFCK